MSEEERACGAVGRAGVFESNQFMDRGKHTREKNACFLQAVGVHKDARKVRERWKTMRKIGCATRIDGVEDVSTMGVRGGRDAL